MRIAGHAVEFQHPMRVWDSRSWRALIAASPSREAAAWDGDCTDRPALHLGPGIERRLYAWHELGLCTTS